MDEVEVLPELPIAEFSFKFQAIDKITFPENPGSLWHSVFGRALREQVCVVPGGECEQCMLLHDCDYSFLFSGVRPPNSQIMRNYTTIPVPHLFRIQRFVETVIDSEKFFHINFILIASAISKFSTILRAFQIAGSNGLGKSRSKFKLIKASQIISEADSPVIVYESNGYYQQPVSKKPVIPALLPTTIQLNFLTPYKEAGNSHQNTLNLQKLLMAIVRRISLLQHFYSHVTLDANYKNLRDVADKVVVKSKALKWKNAKRYSAKKTKAVDTSGWIGELELDMSSSECLLPYLYLGQWLGVGKNSSMGFGAYKINTFATL